MASVSHRGTIELGEPAITGPVSSILQSDETDTLGSTGSASANTVVGNVVSNVFVDAARSVVDSMEQTLEPSNAVTSEASLAGVFPQLWPPSKSFFVA